MRIGVPKEIKVHEYRVGLTPASTGELVSHGHQVMVESGAGQGIGVPDSAYLQAGAVVVSSPAKIFEQADLVVKVKEPQKVERAQLRPGQILFTYLHLASDPEQTTELLKSGASCIGYETVRDKLGNLPLLAPMSEIAGRMAVQAGARALEKSSGGMGLLLGGIPGVPPARVCILGAGVVGSNAARLALGARADVTVLDKNIMALRALDLEFQGRVKLVHASREAVEHAVLEADLVIGAVLVPGAAAPKLVSRAMVKRMKPGSVLVDVAIDQGGCFETSRPTTHADPLYELDGVIHYCVANMPGAVARTSTLGLCNATLPYTLALADKGLKAALEGDPGFMAGLQVHAGVLLCAQVGESLGLPVGPVPLL